eukprot:4530977-Pyramimonas_sp.AAC.1
MRMRQHGGSSHSFYVSRRLKARTENSIEIQRLPATTSREAPSASEAEVLDAARELVDDGPGHGATWLPT